ncbi:MAG: hypothetical protein ABSH09_03805 [Bryobacteraceae bacterium]|jgi:hypothetical protein
MLVQSDRVVVGYHGTSARYARDILNRGEYRVSQNDYDWLGRGVYFWEHAPYRAWDWARYKYGSDAAVLESLIRLGRCLDLTDIRYTDAIKQAFDGLREAYAFKNIDLPQNRGKARRLDCLVINYVAEFVFPECETVRAPFLEGPPIFEGSAILSESHIQVVVRKTQEIILSIKDAHPLDGDPSGGKRS